MSLKESAGDIDSGATNNFEQIGKSGNLKTACGTVVHLQVVRWSCVHVHLCILRAPENLKSRLREVCPLLLSMEITHEGRVRATGVLMGRWCVKDKSRAGLDRVGLKTSGCVGDQVLANWAETAHWREMALAGGCLGRLGRSPVELAWLDLQTLY